ncbi:biotin transporter BioY [Methanoculleus bourgensis]|jgi:biotin transport system substrate-specific component|uniref:Biotin biosynthesis protein BioY n=2 Tax=Methanoculleus bourgensis TaxID=83986 RepID=I7L0I3_METBM|nr:MULTISPECIES: biotin transporter BioY [Methanoculleus]MBT0734253.1 biotin transporter BioY [Methanoculleus bourgensis]MDD3372974.1 biotin transporter BioY [Methanoculleus bourgensis]NMA88068.1 biotin transporter BioY [Methanoculleus bourgensis]NQS77885.1 biotin transporter BioY [Methanoculleus bourgensis]CCJ36875.1 putative biotin biosynthesis protein BioY [Methanoculleus bourgensis MS2]
MKHRAQILAYSGTFIALIAAGSWISIPLPPVPLTLQTLFVLLAGVVMQRYAVIPVGLYVLLGAANLPVFHNGTAGLGVLLGPTGGFLLGFIPAALVAGLAYEHESPKIRVAGLIAATCTIYLFGVVWLAWSASISLLQAVLIGVAPFIIGDAVKAAAAFAIGKRVA